MPYNETLEARLDEVWLQEFPDAQAEVEVKRMFGGLVYLYCGKMTVGIVGEDLLVRIPAGNMAEVLEEPYVRPMDFTGRPMKEFVFVEAEGLSGAASLARWIGLGLEHARGQRTKNTSRNST